MKVLEVSVSIGFQNILTEDRSSLYPIVDRLNKPIGQITFPDFYVSTPKAQVGNFYKLGYELFAYDKVANEAIRDVVNEAGEHYLLEVEDVGTLHVLNVLETCDALDHEKTVWREEDDGGKYVIMEHVFCPERIQTKSGLFKIAENRYSRIFLVAGAPNQQGDFYARYHETGLTGLTFTEIWSDENN